MNFYNPVSAIATIPPTELEKVASSYTYDDGLAVVEQYAWNRIKGYAGDFGHSVVEHLSRVASHYEPLLIRNGVDANASRNLAYAYRLHDGDKVFLPEHLFNLPGKPTPEIKQARLEHAMMKARLLEEALEHHPLYRDHPHFIVAKCLTSYHHERINGSGPHGLQGPQLGLALEIAGIVDTVDGKSIPRGERKVSVAKALQEMTGSALYNNPPKHVDEFSRDLLAKAIEYYQEGLDEPILPPIGTTPQILAM